MKSSTQIQPVSNLNRNDQETTALLKIIDLGNRQIEEGKIQSVSAIIKKLREFSRHND